MRGPLEVRALDLIDSLSVQRDFAWASERAMRVMLGRKGTRPGERSISRVLRRAAKDNKIRRVRVMPGGRLPNGQISKHGTTLNVRKSRQEQRADQRRALKERRAKERATHRPPAPPSPSPASSPPRAPAKDDEEQISFLEWIARHPQNVNDPASSYLAMAFSPRALRRAHPPPE